MSGVALPDALERAASALGELADAIRPANGDPTQLLESLEAGDAGRVLDWLLRHEPEAGAELVAAWAEEPERGTPAILAVDPETLDKAGRKALRRGLHRLRSQGVALPQRPPPPVVAKLPPIEERLDAGLLSVVDPRGARGAYLIEPHPSGGARLFELLIDDERGVLGLEVFQAGRSKVRKFVREVTRRGSGGVVEAPSESVRALVGRIAASQPSDRALPRGFAEWRSHVAAAPEGARTPGELAQEALGNEGGAEAVARVAERVRNGELGPWPPASAAMRALAERIAEIGKGRIVVSGLQRREQIDQAVEEALGEILRGRYTAATAQRLAESAYVAWKSGREDEARDALAAARAVREAPEAGNPVARALLDRTLAPLLAQIEQDLEKEEAESLLVKP